MRADAQRNRDRILEVAREVFRERGYDASLDEIARIAGVGPGTLYRHFPRRENLMDALMQSWVDRVLAAADAAVERPGDPHDRLRRPPALRRAAARRRRPRASGARRWV